MKLHLPKLLRNAVLGCMAAVAGVAMTVGSAAFTGGIVVVSMLGQQALANTGFDSGNNSYIFGGSGNGGTSQAGMEGITESTPEGDGAKLTTYVTTIDSTAKTDFNVLADSGDNLWTNVQVETWKLAADTTMNVVPSPSNWNPNRYFDALTIDTLEIGDGTGGVVLNTTHAPHNIVINNVSGVLKSVSNVSTLTLGSAESSTTLEGSIQNYGTLNLRGNFSISDISGFATTPVSSRSSRSAASFVSSPFSSFPAGISVSTSPYT